MSSGPGELRPLAYTHSARRDLPGGTPLAIPEIGAPAGRTLVRELAWRDEARADVQLAPTATSFKKGKTMLWTIIVILGVLWLLGFSFHVGGGLIHLLLVLALVALVFNFLSGRRLA
jgi:Family of unknown function (DUF5670)